MYPRNHSNRKHRRLATSILCSLIVVASSCPPADAQELDYIGTVAYSMQEEAESATLVNTFGLTAGAFRLSVSFPLVYQNALWVTTLSSSHLTISGNGRRTRRKQITPPEDLMVLAKRWDFGAGDPVVQSTVDLPLDSAEMHLLGISASVKAPVADVDAGFGTGRWDYGIGVSLTSMTGDLLLFGDVGYWWLGDPADGELLDPITASIGVGTRLASDRISIIGSLFGSTAVIEDDPYLLDVAAACSYRLTDAQHLGAYLSLGVTGPQPRLSTGITYRLRFVEF